MRTTASLALALSTTASAQFTLATEPPDNGGLQGWGIAFNLKTQEKAIRIEGIRTYFSSAPGTPVVVTVYTAAGGYQGKTSGTQGWSLVGQATGISAGPNTLGTPLDLVPFNIPADSTTGVYLVATLSPMRYQGTNAGATAVFESDYLTLTGGEAKSAPFTIAGQTFVPRVFSGEIAYSRLPAGGCYPDCDASASLDVFDMICFSSAMALSNPYADCNQDATIDFFDFLCFQTEFAAGCP